MVKKGMSQFNRIISMNLKRIREEKNLTQEYLAECIGKEYSSGYATLEQGKKKLTFEDAVKISQALDVPLSRIIDPTAGKGAEGIAEEDRLPYGNPKKSTMQISVVLDGDFHVLQKQIHLLEKVNDILASESK